MAIKSLVKAGKNNEVSLPRSPLPAMRDVSLPQSISPPPEQENQVITVYRDLLQPARDLALNQQKHLVIAIVVFVILGLGIVMGQQFSKSRGVASVELNKLVPAGAVTASEHYHFDKSCYMGENGEQVCMTRTSQQR